MRRKILITGGSGFIGSNLCTKLLQQKNEVICVDNYFSGNKKNLIKLKDNPYFEIIRHDVTFPLYLEVDEIYNLACPASPIYYQRDPVQTTKSSIHGAINMLGLAKRLKSQRRRSMGRSRPPHRSVAHSSRMRSGAPLM